MRIQKIHNIPIGNVCQNTVTRNILFICHYNAEKKAVVIGSQSPLWIGHVWDIEGLLDDYIDLGPIKDNLGCLT